MRQFVGIDLGCEPVPDETTVYKFRHLLEAQQLGEQILGQVNLHLQAQGVRITTGTIGSAIWPMRGRRSRSGSGTTTRRVRTAACSTVPQSSSQPRLRASTELNRRASA